MRYPNLRYGNPNEFRHYAMGIDLATLSRRLRRDERTIKDWLSGARRLPWWVPEVMRLQAMEHYEQMRSMQMSAHRARLGVVTGDIVRLHIPAATPTPAPQPLISSYASEIDHLPYAVGFSSS